MNESWSVIVLDTETTGTDVQRDQVVELSILAGTKDDAECWTERLRPDVEIHPEASAKHGITAADVKDCPRFKDVASQVRGFLEGAKVIIGYNLRKFDLPLLEAEFERAGEQAPDLNGKHVIDVLCLWQNCEPRTLESAHKRFVGTPLEGAHGAEADTRGTVRVLKGMVKAFELDRSLEAIAKRAATNWIGPSNHFQWQKGTAVVGFGKHHGVAACTVALQARDYLEFIVSKDFPRHVVEISKKLLTLSGRGRIESETFHAWLVASYGPPPAGE